MKLPLLCLSMATCFASTHFDLSGGVGYRRDWMDREVYDFQDSHFKVLDEKLSGINSVQVKGKGALWINYFLLELDADFAWALDGHDTMKSFVNATPPVTSKFHSDIKGHLYDGSLYAGYLIHLSQGPTFSFSLIPQLGYAFYAQTLKRFHTRPKNGPMTPTSTNDHGTLLNNLTASLVYEKDFRRNWYGPFLGCEFFFRLNSKVDFFVGYSYQWLRMNYHDGFRFSADGSLEAVPGLSLVISDRSKECGHYNTQSAQKGWAKITYEVAPRWTLELYSSFLSFLVTPKKLTTTTKETVTFTFAGQQLVENNHEITHNRSKGSWQSFVLEAFARYQF